MSAAAAAAESPPAPKSGGKKKRRRMNASAMRNTFTFNQNAGATSFIDDVKSCHEKNDRLTSPQPGAVVMRTANTTITTTVLAAAISVLRRRCLRS